MQRLLDDQSTEAVEFGQGVAKVLPLRVTFGSTGRKLAKLHCKALYIASESEEFSHKFRASRWRGCGGIGRDQEFFRPGLFAMRLSCTNGNAREFRPELFGVEEDSFRGKQPHQAVPEWRLEGNGKNLRRKGR